jgi:CheY-like chemotaxis protein
VHARPRRVVFLIDSDEATRITHETILRNEGYEILSAPDGTRALPQLREEAPDLVLMSGKIGQTGAIQLIRVMRSDEALRNVKVVLYGAAVDGVAEAARKAGAHGYLELPIASPRLVREVAVLIGRA